MSETLTAQQPLSNPADLDALRFDERGLLPVVAQDEADGTVLMVAWANREALERTLDSGRLTFWSRSRQALWEKGETSGNTLRVVQLFSDCDADTVLAVVRPTGPTCHTGARACFPWASDAGSELDRLWSTLQDRARTRPDGSYTTKLLADENLRLKKLGEENTELVVALAKGAAQGAAEEAADLLYHLQAALLASGVQWSAVMDVLAQRSDRS